MYGEFETKFMYAILITYMIILFCFHAGGQAKTLMFVHINPDIESNSETKGTLEFAERVSGVELGAARSNKEVKI
jgi:hypothetical protein